MSDRIEDRARALLKHSEWNGKFYALELSTFARSEVERERREICDELRDLDQDYQMTGHGDVDCSLCRFIARLERRKKENE